MTPAPVPPTPPAKWDLETIISYSVGMALFIIGVLVTAGVAVPASVSTEVQVIAGAITTILGTFATQVPHLSRASVKRAALKGGASLADVEAQYK